MEDRAKRPGCPYSGCECLLSCRGARAYSMNGRCRHCQHPYRSHHILPAFDEQDHIQLFHFAQQAKSPTAYVKPRRTQHLKQGPWSRYGSPKKANSGGRFRLKPRNHRRNKGTLIINAPNSHLHFYGDSYRRSCEGQTVNKSCGLPNDYEVWEEFEREESWETGEEWSGVESGEEEVEAAPPPSPTMSVKRLFGPLYSRALRGRA